MKRAPVLLAAGLLVLAAACTSGAAGTGPASPGAGTVSAAAPSPAPASSAPSVSVTAAPTSAPTTAASASAVSGRGDAAALCALIIDINTRAGYMVDKTYQNPPTTAVTKQVILEAIARRDEILFVTPPAIHDALAAELDYYKTMADWASQNGWDALATSTAAPPPPAAFIAGLDALNAFLTTQCGIKFG